MHMQVEDRLPCIRIRIDHDSKTRAINPLRLCYIGSNSQQVTQQGPIITPLVA
jgi:hypothetical protein